ncbi:hypothetical protein [Caldanaerobius polysaccharolyticus]|uniref:hypothetical protein n=1 Tax=Caldanaerobius polysaccharolyticus TaxID=44256 RepID=UPI0004797320|nr:hypothetical protein [Caldanaerobius polysaccharolyticus]
MDNIEKDPLANMSSGNAPKNWYDPGLYPYYPYHGTMPGTMPCPDMGPWYMPGMMPWPWMPGMPYSGMPAHPMDEELIEMRYIVALLMLHIDMCMRHMHTYHGIYSNY